MKVYVDELPKECYCCAFNDENVVYGNSCLFGDNKKTCPLQSLTEYTKQVRKEMCEEFMLEYTMGNEPVEDIIYKVANQIQGEQR